jgi:hypothetical protein
MNAVTSVTIALALAQQMNDTKQPNTGQLQPGSPIPAASAVAEWITNNPEAIDFFDIPALDANNTGPWASGLVSPFAIGASLAGMSFLCSQGVSLDGIAVDIAANPYIMLSDLYDGDDMWTDFWNVWQTQVSPVLAPTNSTPNNDPFNAWNVAWPQPQTIEQQILTTVKADLAAGMSDMAICADIAALLTVTPC